MALSELKIKPLCANDIDALQPLVAEFVKGHPSLTFKENHLDAFRTWLIKGLTNNNHLSLRASHDGVVNGFIIGEIRENAPLIMPDIVGYVSMLAVDRKYRNQGIGDALWHALRTNFLSSGVYYFELYTEYENEISGPFWRKRGFDAFLEKRRCTNANK